MSTHPLRPYGQVPFSRCTKGEEGAFGSHAKYLGACVGAVGGCAGGREIAFGSGVKMLTDGDS